MIEVAGKVRSDDNVNPKLVRNAVPGRRGQHRASELFPGLDSGADIVSERSRSKVSLRCRCVRTPFKLREDVYRGIGMDAVVCEPSAAVQGAPVRRDPEALWCARERSNGIPMF